MVVLGVAIILSSHIAMPAISLQTFLAAAVLGVVGILFMTTLVQHGVTHMPVHRSAVISLIELVAGAVSQQLLTDEIVTVREWVGGALIVIGAYLSARATHRFE